MNDYNLTYSQNKNRVFEKNLTATPLKPHHFLHTKISQNQSKPIKTTKHNLEQPPKLVYNQYKHFHKKIWCFHQTNTRKEKLGSGFHIFNLLILQFQAFFFLLISQTLGYLEKIINLLSPQALALSFSLKTEMPKCENGFIRPKLVFNLITWIRPCLDTPLIPISHFCHFNTLFQFHFILFTFLTLQSSFRTLGFPFGIFTKFIWLL